jgi:hypothetical protein
LRYLNWPLQRVLLYWVVRFGALTGSVAPAITAANPLSFVPTVALLCASGASSSPPPLSSSFYQVCLYLPLLLCRFPFLIFGSLSSSWRKPLSNINLSLVFPCFIRCCCCRIRSSTSLLSLVLTHHLLQLIHSPYDSRLRYATPLSLQPQDRSPFFHSKNANKTQQTKQKRPHGVRSCPSSLLLDNLYTRSKLTRALTRYYTAPPAYSAPTVALTISFAPAPAIEHTLSVTPGASFSTTTYPTSCNFSKTTREALRRFPTTAIVDHADPFVALSLQLLPLWPTRKYWTRFRSPPCSRSSDVFN